MDRIRINNQYDCIEYIKDGNGNAFSIRLTDTHCFLSAMINGYECVKSEMTKDNIDSKYFIYPFKNMNDAANSVIDGLQNRYLFDSRIRFSEI